MDTALILAGGSATRFGRPKAFEEVAGKIMVQRVRDAVAPLATEIIVSVSDRRQADAMRPILPSARFVVDTRREAGPIEGILQGAMEARGNRILVAPCDAPLLRTDLYRLLLRHLGGHEAAVPRLEVLDPVRAVYRTSAVRRVLESGALPPSPSALVDRLDAIFVDEGQVRSVDPGLDSFLDVNAPGDLNEGMRRIRSRGR